MNIHAHVVVPNFPKLENVKVGMYVAMHTVGAAWQTSLTHSMNLIKTGNLEYQKFESTDNWWFSRRLCMQLVPGLVSELATHDGLASFYLITADKTIEFVSAVTVVAARTANVVQPQSYFSCDAASALHIKLVGLKNPGYKCYYNANCGMFSHAPGWQT